MVALIKFVLAFLSGAIGAHLVHSGLKWERLQKKVLDDRRKR